jgi:predicted transcriptional regulator
MRTFQRVETVTQSHPGRSGAASFMRRFVDISEVFVTINCMGIKRVAKSKRKIPVSVALAPDLVRRIDRMATATGKSRSELVMNLIEEGIDDSELSAQAMTNPVIVQALMGAFGRPEVIRQMASTMKQELSEDQLKLFGQAMAGMTAVVSSQQPARKEKKQ